MSKREKKPSVADSELFSPPKRPRIGSSNNAAAKAKGSKAATQVRIAANGYRLPDPLPAGEVLTDSIKNQWIVGEVIGCGGFGGIYTARPAANKADDWHYVIKIDHNTGPLYAEMNFYLRVAKEDSIRNWMRMKRLEFLGMPRFIANGIHERPGAKYRFLVIQRFGDDLQKKLNENRNTFDIKTAYTIASKVIDILEYIHSFGYIHADIKASNLLLGRSRAPTPRGKGLNELQGIHSEVWLVDFGLVEKYQNNEGKHKECEEDQRRANNGTVEFTSRDAHIGALSRRSDLEILAFNLLSWLSGGRLPWMSNLKDHVYVCECKRYYMERLHELFNYAFKKPGGANEPSPPPKDVVFGAPKNGPVLDKTKLSKDVPPGIKEFFQYIVNLDFKETPDYQLLKDILAEALAKSGRAYDGKFSFTPIKQKTSRVTAKVASKAKRTSLSAPGARKALNFKDEASDSETDEQPAKRGRTLRDRSKKPATKEVEKNGTKLKGGAKSGRSSSVVAPRKPLPASVSEPNSLTPQKSAATISGAPLPTNSPMNNPTPAMIEMMQKINQKRQLASSKNNKTAAASKLLTSAISIQNKKVARKKSHSAVRSNGDASIPPVKPSAGRIGKASSKAAKLIPVSPPLELSPPKKRVGRPPKNSIERPAAKQLSSNSSTHSTKENKWIAPPRRSPRAKN